MDEDEEAAGHQAFAGSRKRFLALVRLLESDLAMGLPLAELEAMVDPGFQALLAELRKEYRELQAKATEPPESGGDADDAR